jgi:hypothetical protein
VVDNVLVVVVVVVDVVEVGGDGAGGNVSLPGPPDVTLRQYTLKKLSEAPLAK